VALDTDDSLSRAVIADPRTAHSHAPSTRMQMIAELAVQIAEAPWKLSRATLGRAHAAGLSDDDILHVVLLAAYFGHLNRIADAVGVPLDYNVQLEAPKPDASCPPWPTAPELVAGRPAIDIARRPATAAALAEWRSYVFYRDTQVTRRQRTLIARWVASWLGDGGISPPTDLTVNPLDDALRELAEVVTLAPWKLSDESFVRLRESGFDDAAIFDVCATATSAGVFSRIEVALAALSS
jgi:alkylhydroperoxidase family enzyme